MAVLIEGYSVVIRHATIAEKYEGGLMAYKRACPNATFYADDYILIAWPLKKQFSIWLSMAR